MLVAFHLAYALEEHCQNLEISFLSYGNADGSGFLQMKLSSSQQVALRLPLGGPQGQPLTATLTQAELDKLSEPLFKRLRLPVDACCWQVSIHLQTAASEMP